MQNYQAKFTKSIDLLKEQYRYREFIELARKAGEYPRGFSPKAAQEIIVWCSNDYLAMGQNQDVLAELYQAAQKYGVGAGGTRNIAGNSVALKELEDFMAEFHAKEAALVFTSGYVANQAAIYAVTQVLEQPVIFSDRYNHASIIEGIKSSGCAKEVFAHNDMTDLEVKLQKYPKDQDKLIIFEGVYSMNGSKGKAQEIVALAKKYNALTYIDEVHAVGLYGEKGQGIAAEAGVAADIDIIQGTFAKAYGLIGGYITGKQPTIDVVRSYAPGFIFTTAMPPAMAVAAKKSVELVAEDLAAREKFHANIKLLKQKLTAANIEFMQNDSHVISVMIRDAQKVKRVADNLLLKHQIYIQPINYPTVAKGSERLRVTLTPYHSEELMDQLVDALLAEI